MRLRLENDPLREYLDEIIRSVVPKTWTVIFSAERNVLGIDNLSAKIGWGLSWEVNGQSLRVACGTSSMTVDLANPQSKEQLASFVRWLTDWNTRTERPKGLVIERKDPDEEE